MNDSLSQNLLLAIVHGLRRTCKKKIKCENFIVISGFLSCDVDGKAKHRLVINELINSENSGEGHSNCLKVIDWDYLSKRISSQKSEVTCQQNNMHLLKHNPQSRHFQEVQTKSHCGYGTSRMKENTAEKFLTSSGNQCPVTRSRNRLSNQTFTVEDFHMTPSTNISECNLKRNFSSATISIASNNILPDQKLVKNNEQKCPKSISAHNLLTSTCPSTKPLCEDNVSQIYMSNSHEASYFNNKVSDQLNQENNGSQVRINSNIAFTKDNTIKPANNMSSKGSVHTKKLSKTGSNNLKYQCIKSNSKRNTKQVIKLHHISSNGNSDVSLDAVRPRYLVKHNGELLLPCPNLSNRYNKHQAITKNNNRTHNTYPSSKSCDESVKNTSHFSNLFSSIIGALSYSSYTNVHDKSNNKCDNIENSSVNVLKQSDRNDESSNDSLKSMSSLETD